MRESDIPAAENRSPGKSVQPGTESHNSVVANSFIGMVEPKANNPIFSRMLLRESILSTRRLPMKLCQLMGKNIIHKYCVIKRCGRNLFVTYISRDNLYDVSFFLTFYFYLLFSTLM